MTLKRNIIIIGIIIMLPLTKSLAVSTLIKQNPFLPPDYQKKPQRQSSKINSITKHNPFQELELRSIVQFNEELLFSIYNKKEKTSSLVNLNDARADYHVLSYDEKQNKISLKLNNKIIKLTQYKHDGQPQNLGHKPKQAPDHRAIKSKLRIYEMTPAQLSELFPPGHNKTEAELQNIINNAKKAHERQIQVLRRRRVIPDKQSI